MLLALLIASSLGDRIADRAGAFVGVATRSDCSAFTRAIYGHEGIDLAASPARPGENGVTNIHRLARSRRALHSRPRRGDLVFFRDTTSRGGLTHIGIVDSVDGGGRATFVHRASRGVVRSRIDLRHPRSLRSNDVLRKSPRRLAGELVAGFASPDRLSGSRPRTPYRRVDTASRSARGSGRNRRRS
ncbi:MAG: NlpC/P60 family protein [Myxococcales bacterium]|nr:C40 family peptidase [Myxococcales bacterium]